MYHFPIHTELSPGGFFQVPSAWPFQQHPSQGTLSNPFTSQSLGLFFYINQDHYYLLPKVTVCVGGQACCENAWQQEEPQLAPFP